MEIIMNNIKEKIAKNIMRIFIVSIVLIGIYLFSKGQWINGIICSILAFCYSPFFLDKIAEKIGFINDYCNIVRFIVTILFVFLILFILIVFINIMTNYGVSDEVISSRIMAICKCLAYLGYFAIIFLYKDTNKTRKYFVFGITYILCILISYIPNTDYNFIIKILNYLPTVKKLDQESYLLIIDGILMPIKEAFLTYIIFDTVISEKYVKKENVGESKENSEIVKNKSIFKKKSRRLDEEYYNFYTYEEKLIYRYLCGKHIRRKELSKIPELHKFHKYHEWYDYIEKKYGNCSLEGLIEFWHFLNQKSRNVKPKYEYWTLCIPVGLTIIVNEIFDLTLKFSDIKINCLSDKIIAFVVYMIVVAVLAKIVMMIMQPLFDQNDDSCFYEDYKTIIDDLIEKKKIASE